MFFKYHFENLHDQNDGFDEHIIDAPMDKIIFAPVSAKISFFDPQTLQHVTE